MPSARGREAADREVGDEVEAEHPASSAPEVGRQLRAVGERDEDVAADRDDDDEEPEGELGVRRLRRDGRQTAITGCPYAPSWRLSSARVVVVVAASWSVVVVVVVVVVVWSRLRGCATNCLARVASEPARPLWTWSIASRRELRAAQIGRACSTVGFQPSTPPGTPL